MKKIRTIDTSSEAGAVAKKIKESPKTYFLQGKWGSGKTEYLNEIAKHLPKNYRIVWLELWKPQNNDSLAKKLFLVVHPKWTKVLQILGWCFIGLSVIGSIFLALRGILSQKKGSIDFPLMATTIAVILTTLYGFLQSKWLDINKLFLSWSQHSLKSKKKPRLLIIDDFDRLDMETQEDLYILFNAVHESTRIIFIGDMEKLNNGEDNYLGKIIDKKISLPFSLNSSNIAMKTKEAILNLSDSIDEKFDFSVLRSLFISEKRTPRDANQFLAYVNDELVDQNKIGKVQMDQLLFVIYLYLFHQKEYQMLKDGWLPENKEDNNELDLFFDDSNSSEKKIIDNEKNLNKVEQYMRIVFQSRKSNPADFRKNSSVYLVNEWI